ncbi:ATP-binding cassette domain-containing protein [Marinitoga sp. 1137]|uniref:ATP-binding cassette domain-containing protein n=1 Tax=Marinitoga sp. 1137 TaxID=1545835 RepID=UPI0009528936|nr:ATP-binding cassette domain-containing protein [Marinitoga sp. 1137]
MKKYSILGFLIIYLVWHMAAYYLHNELLVPYPHNVFLRLLSFFKTKDFYIDLFSTISKIILGFIISTIIGIPFGILSGLSEKFFKIFRPTLMIIQSSPVVSYIAIAMLWFGIGFYTPVFVSFMVVFPIVVLNISEGIKSTDKKLLEMAKVFEIPDKKILTKIYIPSLVPFLKSTLNLISGNLWKAVVIGEFLAGERGIGVGLSFSKIALDTEGVFAYSVLLAILGLSSEKLLKNLSHLKRKDRGKIPHIKNSINIKKERNLQNIIIEDLNKQFDDNVILQGFNITFYHNKINIMLGESGIGKTTILNLIAELLKPDKGVIIKKGKIGYIFQDDRLIPWLTVYENLELVNEKIDTEELEKLLEFLNLSKDVLLMYPDELSGGMKKRINILRAIVYEPDIILMDEAFSSLDISTKYKVMNELLNIQKERLYTIVMVTHDPFEVSVLGEIVYILKEKPIKIHKKFEFRESYKRNSEENHHILYEINKILLA